jgi:hypothetical protein
MQVERSWLVTRSSKQLELQPRVDDCAITHPTSTDTVVPCAAILHCRLMLHAG